MTELDEGDVRVDEWSTMHTRHVRVTHLPTGTVADAATRRDALRALAEKLGMEHD